MKRRIDVGYDRRRPYPDPHRNVNQGKNKSAIPGEHDRMWEREIFSDDS